MAPRSQDLLALQCPASPVMAPRSQDLLAAASIIFSAFTYLVSFCTNLIVLVDYTKLYASLVKNGTSIHHRACRDQTFLVVAYFYRILAAFIMCHSLNAILFKLVIKQRDAPLCAANFLPLIHLYRLFSLARRIPSCAGAKDLTSSEMNSLYGILGSAMEGVPMLIIQAGAYISLSSECIGSMSNLFKVSVVAALVSAAYNAGVSVQFAAKNAKGRRMKICAGAIGAGFTLCAVTARCLTYAFVLIKLRKYLCELTHELERDKTSICSFTLPLVFGASMVWYSLFFWLFHYPKTVMKNVAYVWRFLSLISYGYLSTAIGPLYCMVSCAAYKNQLGHRMFQCKLTAISLLHVLVDVSLTSVARAVGAVPSVYLLVCMVAATGYMFFLGAYALLDSVCGPERASSDDGIEGTEAAVRSSARDDDQIRSAQMLVCAERLDLLHTMFIPQIFRESKTWPRSGLVLGSGYEEAESTSLQRSKTVENKAMPR